MPTVLASVLIGSPDLITSRNIREDAMSKMYGLAWVNIGAYNLIEGAAFREESTKEVTNSDVHVVVSVLYRSHNAERIGVLTRVLNEWEDVQDPNKVPVYDTFSFHFADTVQLVGLCVNRDSWDDMDFGQVD